MRRIYPPDPSLDATYPDTEFATFAAGASMSAAIDPRAAAENKRLAAQVASLQAGHLAAQRVLWAISRQGGQELVDEARRSLGDDADALAAFARSLLRGRPTT